MSAPTKANLGVSSVLVAINTVICFYKINSSKISLKSNNETTVDQAGSDWPLINL